MTKIKKLKSGSWHTLVYAGTTAEGKREYKSITAPTKAECEYLVAEFKKQKQKTDVTRNKTTLRQACNAYIEEGRPFLAPDTLNSYENMARCAFKGIMDMPLEELTQKVMEKAVEDEMKILVHGKPISAKTIKNRWGLINAVLKKHGLHFTLRMPKVRKKNRLLPEPQEVIEIIKDTNIELPCLLAMWMSLREAEIIGITLGSIHKDLLTIDRSVTTIKGRKVVKEYAKTDESIRTLKIPPYILELIHNTEVWKNRTKLPKNTFLFDYTGSALYKRFKKKVKRAGLDLTFHDLRHYFASISLNKLEIPEKQVQRDGGWKTDAVMKKIYSQSFGSVEQEAFEKRNKFFNKLVGLGAEYDIDDETMTKIMELIEGLDEETIAKVSKVTSELVKK